MNPTSVKNRALATYSDATPEQVKEGKAWYPGAKQLAWDMTTMGDARYDLDTSIRIIATLSPRCRWDKNVKDALFVADGGDPLELVGTLGNSRKACQRVIEGGVALSGRKVRAFAKAIKGDEDAVVVDAWTFRAVGGEKDAPGAKEYRTCVSGIVRAAIQIGTISPRDLQAVIWVVARGRAD